MVVGDDGLQRAISIARGDDDWLPATGNALVACGALLNPDSVGKIGWPSSSRQQFSQWSRLRECKRTDPPETVFEVVLQGEDSEICWTLFDPERIANVGS